VTLENSPCYGNYAATVATHADGGRVVFTAVFFQTISKKRMQLGSPNVTYERSTMILETSLSWGKEVKGQGHGVCVGLQTQRNIAAAVAYLSPAGFFLL